MPQATKEAMAAKYPKASDVKWEIVNGTDLEAEFKEDGVDRSATFNEAGGWLKTETEIKVEELPMAVTRSIRAHYADRKMHEVSRIETADRGTLYEIEFKDEAGSTEILFDENGASVGSESLKEEEDNDKDQDDD